MKIIYAKSAPEWTTLLDHTKHVVLATQGFAAHVGLDVELAKNGAILHDLGKAHTFFQERLQGKARRGKIFRHEIASLFFLSIFPKEQWSNLVEMVVGHHKSVRNDVAGLGLLDLEETEDYIDFHLGNWDEWSKNITPVLEAFDIYSAIPSEKEALDNLQFCIDYCERETRIRGYSVWRGILMGGDHFASAQAENTEKKFSRLFRVPNLSFYNRQHHLYPLSLMEARTDKKHTLVVAPTGAGKTDYLLRRCKGRVFYTLPFQASINAMYNRVGSDIEADNPVFDLRVMHSSSQIIKRKEDDDTGLQGLFGASVTILTPHQLATIAFGQKGFETVLLDIRSCDVILDEVHTYSGVSQAMVIKLIEILKRNDCRLHIGTATMPTLLYEKIKEVLGVNEVLEVALPDKVLEGFNRHIIHKLDGIDEIWSKIDTSVVENEKVLIVLNRVKDAQSVYNKIKVRYPKVNSMLIHSRFKRGDRNKKERDLIGLDEKGNSLYRFNTGDEACIVVSTQVVEVSLDISFDIMFTQAAPLDALIQRFGRVNRKRTEDTIGKYKDIYVIAPPKEEKEARPYDVEIIKRSFDALTDGALLKESEMQQKIDTVFTELNLINIEEHSIFKSDGAVTIDKLTHSKESVLMQLLEIDSVVCVTESDVESYLNGELKERMMLEIPSYYYAVKNMEQLDKGNKPFVIPDLAYTQEYGLDISKAKLENLNIKNRIL